MSRPAAAADGTAVTARERVPGVDLARGLALLGMMAAHVFDLVGDDGPTATGLVASGRSATLFAVLAGVSLAFLSGGQRVVQGPERQAVRWGLVTRAVLIGIIGLLLGFTDAVAVILPFYAVLFLLAIPLLAASPRVLLTIAAVLTTVGPVLLLVLARSGVEFGERADPTPVTLLTEPVGVLAQLFLTGSYPVVLYLAFVCVGLAIGRLDLGSGRSAWLLLGGGLALAVLARTMSWVLLYPLGGMARLLADEELEDVDDLAEAEAELLWDTGQGTSWDYLALASPHGHTQLDMLHVLGSAVAVLAACLLLCRVSAARRLLAPLAAAGSMSLTIYTAHILVLQSEVLEDYEGVLYATLVGTALVLASLWRRTRGQGPLERLVAHASRAARRAALARTTVPR